MNILFDINHPADVHFFKFTIQKLQNDGHTVFITARNKDVVIPLLERLELPFRKLSSARSGLFFLAFELIQKDIQLLVFFIKYKIDIAVAFTGTCTSQVGWLLNIPRLVFYDNDEATLQNLLTYPFASKIYTPECYPKNLGKKHYRFKGIKELAYLHPRYFKADKKIYSELDIESGEKYIIIRTVSWGATHDVGQSGISEKVLDEIISKYSLKYKIFIIAENEIEDKYKPYLLPSSKERIHHVLAYAALFIGEGATMACECACIGTPAIYVNTLNPSHVLEVEDEGLVFYLNNDSEVINTADKIFKEYTKNEWVLKSKKYVESKEDVSQFVYKSITCSVKK